MLAPEAAGKEWLIRVGLKLLVAMPAAHARSPLTVLQTGYANANA